MVLLVEYALDEGSGSTFTDEAAQTTGTSAAWTATGHTGSALTYGEVNINAVAVGNGEPWSVAFWMRPISGSTCEIVRLGHPFAAPDSVLKSQYVGGSAQFWGGSGASTTTRVTTAVPTGTWAHIAVTYSETQLVLYRDGAVAQTLALSGLTNPIGRWWLGDNSPAGAVAVDDFRLYDHVLTLGEVQTAMANPPGGAAPTPAGSSVTPVTVAAPGAGLKVAAGSSTATAGTTPSGAGQKVAHGASIETVGIAAAGSGRRVQAGSGVSAAGVSAVGSGRKVTAGSSTPSLGAGATGSGRKVGAGSSAGSVQAGAAGGGAKRARGAATSAVRIATSGLGERVQAGRGSSEVQIGVTSAGVGVKVGTGGTVTAAAVTTVGSGHRLDPGRGGSSTHLGVATAGSGRAVHTGGTVATLTLTTSGLGRNAAAPDPMLAVGDVELVLAGPPRGSRFATTPRPPAVVVTHARGSALHIHPPRRQA